MALLAPEGRILPPDLQVRERAPAVSRNLAALARLGVESEAPAELAIKCQRSEDWKEPLELHCARRRPGIFEPVGFQA